MTVVQECFSSALIVSTQLKMKQHLRQNNYDVFLHCYIFRGNAALVLFPPTAVIDVRPALVTEMIRAKRLSTSCVFPCVSVR